MTRRRARGGEGGGERATGAAGEARVVVGEDETRRVRTTDGRTPRGAEGASATGPRAPRRTTRMMRTRNPVGSGRSSVPVQPAPQTRVEEEPRGDAHRERDRRHLDARRVRHRHRADACAGGERARADREAAAKTTSRESARAKSARRGDGIVVIFSEASDSLTGRRVVRQVRPAARSTLSSSFPCAASFAPSLASPPPSSAPPPPPSAPASRRAASSPPPPALATSCTSPSSQSHPVASATRPASRTSAGTRPSSMSPWWSSYPPLCHGSTSLCVVASRRYCGGSGQREGEASSDGRRTKGKKMWRQARPRRARDDRYPRPRARTLSTATPTPTSTKSASRDRFSVARLDRLSEPRNAIARAPGGRAAAQCARRANDRRKNPTGRRSPGGSSWKNDR